MFGGTLLDGEVDERSVCLAADTCYYLLLDYYGSAPAEIEMNMCGTTIAYNQIGKLCVDATASSCELVLVTADVEPVDSNCTSVAVILLDQAGVGWPAADFNVISGTGSFTGGNSSFGFLEVDNICLPDGCYSFNVHGAESVSQLWSIHGVRGPVPWDAEICVEKAYGSIHIMLMK